ncbi:unnamed protein product [Sphagnum jensenii]|uniref:Uncharacterized protein n=1 Tax=Sphagnum jensenii TaxID=128206 RepID=A0ABP1AI84_9BRYO
MALTMLKSSKGRRIPALSEPPEAIMTDYEREREENIRRNALIMEKLGISGAKENLEKVVSVRKQLNTSVEANMDFAPIADRRTALLAAGGHNGRIAVFGIESGMCARPSTEIKEVEAAGPIVSSKEESPDEACEPLLSWKGSSGWISQVHFLSQQPQGATLLLSSSNDGSIVIWDLNKQQATPKVHNGRAGRALQVGMPRIVTERQSLHSNGIFAMHELDGQIVTGSKDCSVALSVVKDAGISKERVIEGHHMGAIRGVRFRLVLEYPLSFYPLNVEIIC